MIPWWLTAAGRVARALANAEEDKVNAETDRERIRADVSIAQLEARKQSLIAGQGSWVSKAVQAAWAAPFVIYNGKIIIWDKVLGWGVTDPLGPFETNLGLMIAGFYFLTVGASAVFGKRG